MSGDIRSNEFRDAVVAVVGGNLGVGLAIVETFQAQGARVVVGNLAGAPAAASAPGLWQLPVDMADPHAADAFLDGCEREAAPVEVLVLVSPPVRLADAIDIPPERLEAVVREELLGPMQLLQACARRMRQREVGGRLMSFVSMSGKTGVHKHVSPYAAAKGGVIAYSRSLAAELAPFGITVNVIATALFEFQLTGKTPEARAVLEAGIPVGRAGRSAEAAHAALFLASREAGFVTGETLNLSGGRFMD